MLLLAISAVVHGSPHDLHHHHPLDFPYAHHFPAPLCKHEVESVTKEFCHIKPKRVCETKTHEFKVVTGHEKGECKQVEVCKHPAWRRRRSPHDFHHEHTECEKEMKEVCKVVPTVEEKSEDFEVCRLEPEKVCEEKEVQIPKLVCEQEGNEAKG